MTNIDDQMREALNRQRDHVIASYHVDRRGWSRAEWVADAQRLMSEPDGSVMDLVNGHILALLAEVEQLRAQLT